MSSSSCDPGAIALARSLFETTQASQAEIARSAGLSATSLARYAKRQDWRRPASTASFSAASAAPSTSGDPAARLTRRLWAALERRIEIAEAAPDATPMRDLVTLARALRDLAAISTPPAAAIAPEADEEADADSLRAELAARLDRILAP